MTREEKIEQLENTILLIKQNGKDWWDERDIPVLEEAIKAMKMEPCEDCISRQAVLSEIEAVCFSKAWSKFRADNGSNGTRDYIINYIKQLPPVQPEQKWIPVSERLPEKVGYYLTTILSDDEYHRYRDIIYFGDDKQWTRDCNVIAWMPLPEPYKVESEDT